ncbi:glutamate receptor 2.7-like [Cornus florida]|uniref:glutamate receptor 2.7-like n=1 Tax=Cornus florida TaxID=4283 RepID=UPI00289BE707|nr:glutamate receptor 2.7-like [Cornus florida]
MSNKLPIVRFQIKMRRRPTQLVFSPFFFLSALRIFLVTEMALMSESRTNTPVNVNVAIGVVLDLNNSWKGQMGLSCISMALSDLYHSHTYYKTRLVLHTRDSKDDVVVAASAALDLLKNVQVQAIIGPATSMQADFVIDLGDKAQVPIISFSATNPSLSSSWTPYFVRATQSDSSQTKAISAIVKAHGWREAVLVYVDNDFGEGIIPFLTDALQEINTRVPYRSVIPPRATDDQIAAELYKLMTMPTRVFIVHMLHPLGSRLFTKAKEVGMMSDGYVWIMTNGITNLLSSLDTSVIDSMQGVLGVKPYVPRTKELKNFEVRLRRKFQQENPTVLDAKLSVFGLWAYDAATALAIAAEKVFGATNSTSTIGYQKANTSAGNYTDLETFGVSQHGPMLLKELLGTKLRGLSGDFHIVDGQLQSSAFQIVNVIGNGEKGIGFWTPGKGITREWNSTSTSRNNLGTIIWPGDTTSLPKGWVIPTNEKKLRIGVPVKHGFIEFVKVEPNNQTNTTKVTGFCIDIFDVVMASLPYPVPYEYMPFMKPDGSYNELVQQVFLGIYDAVVGDITVIANRSQFVDYTLPYIESGISLVVPIKDNKRKNAWVFLKPLTWELWLITFCSFVFIGFVIYVLEHRINEDFRGPPSHQVGMIFWFSFSTMVFAHKEKVLSNLARFVVIIWVFVVLILTQSYTASLTSMLTVQHLQPTVTNINELVKKGESVGYQKGSFILELLKKNFDESKLMIYNTSEELHELFKKGSGNGGIAAAVDEFPYMKLFLRKYCSKYTMVQPTNKTDGFGFVFPIGSPLIPDVSRAILKVTQEDKMVEIERKWFGDQSSCPDLNTLISSDSLGLESFWGLFIIAGIASTSALIVHISLFLYEHRHVLSRFEPKTSIWRKITVMVRYFDEKDLSSHTFRKSELRDRNSSHGVDGMNANCPPTPSSFSLHASPHPNGPPSPSSFSIHKDGNPFM